MEHGLYIKTRAELEALAADAADRKAWAVFNRLIAEMSCLDRHGRADAQPKAA